MNYNFNKAHTVKSSEFTGELNESWNVTTLSFTLNEPNRFVFMYFFKRGLGSKGLAKSYFAEEAAGYF